MKGQLTLLELAGTSSDCNKECRQQCLRAHGGSEEAPTTPATADAGNGVGGDGVGRGDPDRCTVTLDLLEKSQEKNADRAYRIAGATPHARVCPPDVEVFSCIEVMHACAVRQAPSASWVWVVKSFARKPP